MDPAAISTGMNEGLAQVFKQPESLLPTVLKLAEAQRKEAAAKAAKKAADTKKQTDKILGKEYKIWAERDSPYFIKKSQELWDFATSNDLDNDPAAKAKLNQMAAQLNFDAQQSTASKEEAAKYAEDYRKNPNLHFDENFNEFTNFAKTEMAPFNPSWYDKKIDMEKWLQDKREESIKEAEYAKEKSFKEGTIGAHEYTIGSESKGGDLATSENKIKEALHDKAFYKTAEYMMKKDDPDGKIYNGNVSDYALKTLAPKATAPKISGPVSASRITEGRTGAGGTAKYGTMSIDKLDTQLEPTIISGNPQFASELINMNPRWKNAFEATGGGSENAAAKWANANLPSIEAKIIPITKTDATANKIFNWKDSKGNNVKGSFANFVDVYGKLYVQVDQNTYDEDDNITGSEKKILPFNAENVSTVNNEYSDKKSGHNVYDALTDFGYGDKLKQFNINTSKTATGAAPSTGSAATGGAKTTTSTTTTGATPTTATKTTTGGATAANQTTSKQYGGDWNDEWTKAILAHERAVGAPGGNPFTSGYNDDEWLGKKAKKNIVTKYVNEVKKQLPEYSSLPDAFKIRLVDYKFNSGRDPRVAILEGLGLIKGDITYKGSDGKDKTTSIRTYLHNEGKADVDKYWNKNKTNIDMSDPATMKAFDDARTEITKATNKPGTVIKYSDGSTHVVTQEEYEGNINKNQLPRITLADQIVANKPTTNVKRDAAGNTYGGGAKPQLTEAEWNKQWAALPKGKSMVGLDGKTYTKK